MRTANRNRRKFGSARKDDHSSSSYKIQDYDRNLFRKEISRFKKKGENHRKMLISQHLGRTKADQITGGKTQVKVTSGWKQKKRATVDICAVSTRKTSTPTIPQTIRPQHPTPPKNPPAVETSSTQREMTDSHLLLCDQPNQSNWNKKI